MRPTNITSGDAVFNAAFEVYPDSQHEPNQFSAMSNSEGTAARAYFVDDDSTERERMLQTVRTMDLHPVGFNSAEDFLQSVSSDFGVVVSEIRLPGMSGLELQKALIARELFLPVVIVTGVSSIRFVVEAMKNGASTVLEKPASEEDLWLALRAAISTHRDEFQRQEAMLTVKAEIDSLTPQEKEVLELIVEGVKNNSIAQRLDISTRTVEARRKRILTKLNAESLAALVRKVVTLELVHPPHSGMTRPAHLRYRPAPSHNE